MTDFISGILIESRDGATYMGHVFDRFLRLQHRSGEFLSIFDPDAISGELSVGESYEMVLEAFVLAMQGIKLSPVDPVAPVSSVCWGTVIEPIWQFPPNPEEHYSYYGQSLHTQRPGFALVETPLGCLVIGLKQIEEAVGTLVQRGDNLQWEKARLDLCAVL